MGLRARTFCAAMSVCWLAVGTSPAAFAQDAPAPEPRCNLGDDRLAELSGMATGDGRWYVVNDGGESVEIYVLGRDCAVQDVITSPRDPYDVEDLAREADGTLWLGDTGDNRKRRDTVALLEMSPDGQEALHRLTYPDGQHDSEALLVDRDGTPYIVTKDVLGASGVYRPVGALRTPGPTKLKRIGTLNFTTTDTPGGPVGPVGSILVTGGASSVDGRVVALRTYTDAYLYPVGDGDLATALRQNPVRVPLPNEKQGEAIAFEPDGALLSASEGIGSPVRAVAGATDLVNTDAAPQAGGVVPGRGGDAASDASSEDGLPVLPSLALAVGAAAVIVFGYSRLRRPRRR